MDVDRLEAHRIVALDTVRSEVRFPNPIGKNAIHPGIGDRLRTQVRVLVTDGGAVGWGHSLADHVEPGSIIGRRVSDIFDVARGTTDHGVLALDFALHDLAGQILNRPVYELIDDRAEPDLTLYYGSIDMIDVGHSLQDGARAVIQACERIYEKGYRSFKLKIGRGFKWMSSDDGLRRDVDITRILRHHFQDCRILVDANDGLTYEECIQYLSQVADCGLFWIEEPFPENERDLDSLRSFLKRTGSRTLVADGETGYDIDHIMRLSQLGLIDVALMDIGRLGFTRWRFIARQLLDNGTAISPHTCCNPLKIIYACHLAAGFGSKTPIEAFSARCHGLGGELICLSDGSFRLDGRPGFGLHLDDERR